MTTTPTQISQQAPMVHELARIYGFNASEALQKLATDMADLSPGDQHEADAMNVAVELSGREQIRRIYEHEDSEVVLAKSQRRGNWATEEQQESALRVALKATVHRRPTLLATQKAATRIGKQAIRALLRAAKAAEKAQKAARKAQKAAEKERKAAEKQTKAAERAAEKQRKAAIRIGKQAIRAAVKAARKAEKAQKAAEKAQKAAERERKAAEKERKTAETHAQC